MAFFVLYKVSFEKKIDELVFVCKLIIYAYHEALLVI